METNLGWVVISCFHPLRHYTFKWSTFLPGWEYDSSSGFPQVLHDRVFISVLFIVMDHLPTRAEQTKRSLRTEKWEMHYFWTPWTCTAVVLLKGLSLRKPPSTLPSFSSSSSRLQAGVDLLFARVIYHSRAVMDSPAGPGRVTYCQVGIKTLSLM